MTLLALLIWINWLRRSACNHCTVQLKPTPLLDLRAIYRTVFDAAKAVSTIMSQAVVLSLVPEFIDGNAINMIR